MLIGPTIREITSLLNKPLKVIHILNLNRNKMSMLQIEWQIKEKQIKFATHFAAVAVIEYYDACCCYVITSHA